MNLSRFQKPSRYIGHEVNSVRKEAPDVAGAPCPNIAGARSPLRVCLTFPDAYEIGMSHLGLKILYHIINDLPYASAERAFHPWADLEAEMRQKSLPLSSLETGRPLKEFDIVGFSLQYELSYTAVLNMLNLGNIPLRSEERGVNDPLIIAGGPCTVNPLPMSPFIDAFLVGDGEEAIKEILSAAFRWKKEGDGKKDSLLKALSGIGGVYVPALGGAVRRRFISSLDDAPYPLKPIVPFAEVVHDRLNIEISRGCTMGCRFCQAGMIYRPLRERSPERVLEIAGESLDATGYEEVSFTSLSAGDYSCLLPLLKEFNKRFSDGKVALSLPSLRVKAVNEEVLREVKSVRKTGFTIAPEAATQRLRAVINKDFVEEDYEKALVSLFKEGWHNLKLYFMIGLPTETDGDIEAIREMARKALRVAKGYTGRFVNITVSVSPFVPKPHTPFQWQAQEDIPEMRRKKDFLRGALRGISVKGHNEHMSALEAAIARGDERLSGLIEAAYMAGGACTGSAGGRATLDAWTESFDISRWLRAMERTGVDAFEYARRKYSPEAPLPWDRVETGVGKDFLKRELKQAFAGRMTEDCRASCSACGLGCEPQALTCKPRAAVAGRPPATLRRPLRLRVEFSKTGVLRYLSHRELINHIERAIRRAGIRVDYSKGFHPSPKLSFGPPLNVGVAGLREYFDMEVLAPYDLEGLRDMLNRELAEGIRISRVMPVRPEEPSLQSFISKYEYEIGAVGATGPVRVVLMDTAQKKVKLDEALRQGIGRPLHELSVTRLAMYGFDGNQWLTPLKGPERDPGKDNEQYHPHQYHKAGDQSSPP